MKPFTMTTSDASGGVKTSEIYICDIFRNPFNIGIGVIVTGTVNYDIEHTFDNPNDPTVTPVWFDHATLVGDTANADGNYQYPVRAIRLVQNSGNGSVRAVLIQAGVHGS